MRHLYVIFTEIYDLRIKRRDLVKPQTPSNTVMADAPWQEQNPNNEDDNDDIDDNVFLRVCIKCGLMCEAISRPERRNSVLDTCLPNDG